ncbi:DUF7738 domain-containing protein [Apibacter adventoris]|uniref:DUF7738 domain-containing protein n=1 Tax=Apibacter adventoris TaxID=1679466 RepID=A0A2S8AEH5_9FLAO|nr:hypothetical protein [Apibacter adventoris]PQL93515.1 hypothetical protein C4S77_04490 [Apibacter adventoris]
MRNNTVLIFLLGFCSFYTQCQTKEPPKPMDTEFTITPCQITYKGKELPLGKPFKEWIKIFGEYNRFVDGVFIWDTLGIGATIHWDAAKYYKDTDYNTRSFIESRPTIELYIFFVNLDSKVGQAGKLQYAWGYYPITKEKEKRMLSPDLEYPDVKPFTQEELTQLKEKHDPKNYIYPFTPYTQTVNLQGAPVKSGMSLEEVNKERSKIKGLEKMGYWDNDGDWSWDSGSTTIKTGEFREQKDHSSICPNQDYWYYITLRYSEGELEYLKISYELYEK